MKKKGLAFLLAMIMTMSTGMTAFAASPVSSGNDIPNGFVLIDEETTLVDDGEGNMVEVTIEEYGKPGSESSLNREQNERQRGYIKEYEVGTEKYFVFKISNNAIGFPSLAVGTPLTSAMKKAIANIVKEKLGEKLASQFIPGLNIVSWVLAAIAFGNSVAGNNGFKVSVDCVYRETYLHKEGYYMYGWDITDCSFGVY